MWCFLFRKGLIALSNLGDLKGLPLRFKDQPDLATLQDDLYRILLALRRQVVHSWDSSREEHRGFGHLLGLGWKEAAAFTAIDQAGFETVRPTMSTDGKTLLIVSDSTLGSKKSSFLKNALKTHFLNTYSEVFVSHCQVPLLECWSQVS